MGAGRPFSSFGPGLDAYPPTPFTLVGIRFDPAVHDARIDQRFRDLLDVGVRRGGARPGPDGRAGCRAPPARPSGTGSCWRTWKRGLPSNRVVEEAKRRTRAFARRQWAWFRRDPRIVWLDPNDDLLAQLLAVWDAVGNRAGGVWRRVRRRGARLTTMDARGTLRLTKHHGAGNDFLVMLDPDDRRPLSAAGGPRPVRPAPGRRGRRRAARHLGPRARRAGDGPAQRRRWCRRDERQRDPLPCPGGGGRRHGAGRGRARADPGRVALGGVPGRPGSGAGLRARRHGPRRARLCHRCRRARRRPLGATRGHGESPRRAVRPSGRPRHRAQRRSALGPIGRRREPTWSSCGPGRGRGSYAAGVGARRGRDPGVRNGSLRGGGGRPRPRRGGHPRPGAQSGRPPRRRARRRRGLPGRAHPEGGRRHRRGGGAGRPGRHDRRHRERRRRGAGVGARDTPGVVATEVATRQ